MQAFESEYALEIYAIKKLQSLKGSAFDRPFQVREAARKLGIKCFCKKAGSGQSAKKYVPLFPPLGHV